MALRIQAVTDRAVRTNIAIRAYKVTDGIVRGGPATPVYKITDADLIENGGVFKVSGNSASEFLVYEVTGESVKGGPAIPIYIVNDSIAFIGPYENIDGVIHIYEIARRTLSTYTGSLLTIRRTSDNMEMDFGYDADGFLDVEGINAWLGGSPGKVVTVYDQIGGDDLTQSIIANQLDYIPSGQNGNPTMGFDGTNTFIQGVFSSLITQPYTIYATAKLDVTAVNDDVARYILDGSDAINRSILGKIDTESPDAWHIFAGNDVPGDSADSSFNVWAALFNGANSNFWINGSLQ